MKLLVKNIGTLVGIDESGRLRVCGSDMANIATLEGAWLLAEEGRICDYGTMDNLPSEEGCEVLDAEGGWLFPSFCDSHTHIVYAGSREQEFLDKKVYDYLMNNPIVEATDISNFYEEDYEMSVFYL